MSARIVRSLAPALVALAVVGFGLPFAAAPARPAEDAGTQSVFAYGAGNRALAMGNAFVATADDASAMVWNPAGLARLTRAEFQAAQSVDLGMGVSESYAAFALPSWRWGAAGITLRHFGVGGVEQRDERNVLLSSDLSDSELEIAIGYGRALGDAWSVGGALKLQHQSLAGRSGSGLGADVGVTARPAVVFGLDAAWAEGLSWGLALRNAVAPSIRLDQESVPDALALRSGLAWRGPAPSGGGMLVELDVSRATHAAPRVHAGLEYEVHPAAALRLGMNQGRLTAGAGLRWRDVSLEYAFEDAALAAGHRAGLTFRFGATTEENRIAHRRREDEQVEKRLAEAFVRRQAEQVAVLLERAAAERASGDLDGALEALAVIATLEPGNAEALALEGELLRDKARELERGDDFAAAALMWDRVAAAVPGDSLAVQGAARARAESERRARRGDELKRRFDRALDAFAREDLAAARAGFRSVLAAEPADAEAARMLARTEQAIGRRVVDLAEQAARALRAGDFDGAEARIAEAVMLDPQAPAVAQAQLALTRARLAAEAARVAARSAPARPDSARVAARAAPPAGPRLSDREVEELYQRGWTALRAQRTEDALRYWELVWSARPGYREVAAYLKREYLARGMEAFASGRLDDAVAHWERVLRVDPNDARARGYLDRARTQRAKSREILGGNR